ncbi:YciI family protein [Microbacterium sp. M3]|uniref:YciI family protein n=1 Tax=Microbacterium arthrosphaerae TaxID=792652 RepID=A0ABU4H538_9MICO|nr:MULTISPECIES: YciI family protein [Microbacterium]MDW4574443.1 YciI family protein [Microbacterium arthrosphaerae]MDW7608298.1 YciI family protein [Microbacterium sp. M3]
MSTALEYLVTAFDGTDEGALDRRLAVRDAHLAGAQRLAERGELLSGGAILDDEGRMIGSSMHVVFADQAAFDAWYAAEPYITGDVWRDITVRPMRIFRPAL